MTMYQLPDWLGGGVANLVHGPEANRVTVEPWANGRPCGEHVTLYEFSLTRLPDPDAPTPQQVLATPMPPNDVNAPTVRAYLVAILDQVWREREGFSGKRPFGNSDWDYALYAALGASGYIMYDQDQYGYAGDVDREAGDELIAAAIEALSEEWRPDAA